MRWPTPSRAAISRTSRTNSATCCCRSSTTPAWPRSKAPSISATWCEGITAKMVRRHPHVFADAEGRTAKAVEGLWERIKAEEKAGRGEAEPEGALAGVPVALPALTRALKLQNKAGRVGFDWNDPRARSRQNPRGGRRNRSRTRPRRPSQGRGRGRRSSVRGGQPRPPFGRRSGRRSAADKPEIRTPFRLDRTGIGRDAARRRKTQLSPRWMRSGTPPRRRKNS